MIVTRPLGWLLTLLVLLSARVGAAQEWTRFRGPNGNGISEATTIPVSWTDKDYRWRVELPGIGYSSPVIWGQRVFVTSAVEEPGGRAVQEVVRSLRTTDGGLAWERRFPSTTHPKHRFNCYASSTPAVDQDRLYFTWATPKAYHVVALEQLTGRTLWERGAEEGDADLGPFEAEHGFGSSPMLAGDLVILSNDQDGASSVIALERATGKTRWKARRDTQKTAYSTPFLLEPKGAAAQLITTSWAHGISSLDPSTGALNWELNLLPNRVVGSGAVVGPGLIVAGCGTGGVGTHMIVVRPAVPGKQAKAELAYRIPKGAIPYVPTTVTNGPLMFLWFDRGVVSCLDAATGNVRWRERIGGDYFGSPVRVADRLYCISREGELVVLSATDKFKLLARINLGQRSNSTPAVAGGVMYLRTVSHLMAIGGK